MTTEENTQAEAETLQTTTEETTQEEVLNTEPETIETPDPSEAENTDSENTEEEPPRKNRAQERIQQLVQRAKDAEARAENAERRLSEYEEPKEVGDLYDYENSTEFHKDLARSVAEETRKELAETAAKQAQEEAAQAKQLAFQARVQAAMESIPDIVQSLNAVGNMVSQDVADMIITSDKSVEIVNYLAKNPLEAQELQNKSPIQVARTIGGLCTSSKPLGHLISRSKVYFSSSG